MKPERQIEEMARIDDRMYQFYDHTKDGSFGSDMGRIGRSRIPDYLNDHNAVHWVLMGLSDAKKAEYTLSLESLMLGCDVWLSSVERTSAIEMLCDSTPAEMTEAILRAHGKWEDA